MSKTFYFAAVLHFYRPFNLPDRGGSGPNESISERLGRRYRKAYKLTQTFCPSLSKFRSQYFSRSRFETEQRTWNLMRIRVVLMTGLYVLPKFCAVMFPSRDVQVKLWDPLRTRAIPERLRGAFTTRRYTNPRLPLPLPLPSLRKWGYKLWKLTLKHGHALPDFAKIW